MSAKILEDINTVYYKSRLPYVCLEFEKSKRTTFYIGITYTDHEVTVPEIQEAVQEELHGPGKMLGYRMMQQKV